MGVWSAQPALGEVRRRICLKSALPTAATSAARRRPLSTKHAEALRQTYWKWFVADALIDFFAMNGDVFRRVEADANLRTLQ
jgi:hypothetical protein